MSKVGLKAIKLEKAVVNIDGRNLSIKGPKGYLEYTLPEGVVATLENSSLFVRPVDGNSRSRATKISWGMSRAILANKVKGVETGFETKINIVGLGYKAVLSGNNLSFSLGYSHKIDLEIPEGLLVNVSKTGQEILVNSIERLSLGNFCAKVKALRSVEPYKGTGIFLEGEKIHRKAGKAKKS
jgi:large subunit ribosomal protein L6